MIILRYERGGTMRFTDLEKHKALRKKERMNTAKLYGIPSIIIIFLLFVGYNLTTALLMALFFGAGFFFMIYYFRGFVDRAMERRRDKLELLGPYIDVQYGREMGVLMLLEDRFVFQTLTPGAVNKKLNISINDALFIGVGKLNYRKLEKYKYKGIESGYIMMKEMPVGMASQFVFYDYDGLLEKMVEHVNQVNKFNAEKYN